MLITRVRVMIVNVLQEWHPRHHYGKSRPDRDFLSSLLVEVKFVWTVFVNAISCQIKVATAAVCLDGSGMLVRWRRFLDLLCCHTLHKPWNFKLLSFEGGGGRSGCFINESTKLIHTQKLSVDRKMHVWTELVAGCNCEPNCNLRAMF